jgi:Glycosyl hydrolases family 18
MTETLNTLAMITKAGVPSNKIVVGVSSYGRSFHMTQAGCDGPMCTYTGKVSGAKEGRCTGTSGYLADAEIKEIINSGRATKQYLEPYSNSDIIVYDQLEWVAYMSPSTKTLRASLYQALNFAGTTDWAIDLEDFVEDLRPRPTPGPNTASWRTKNCNDPGVTNIHQDPSARWNSVGAGDAWDAAIQYWKGIRDNRPPNTPIYTFSQEVSTFFNSSEWMKCGHVSETSGCILGSGETCNDQAHGTVPAEYFITGSLKYINGVSLVTLPFKRCCLIHFTAAVANKVFLQGVD